MSATLKKGDRIGARVVLREAGGQRGKVVVRCENVWIDKETRALQRCGAETVVPITSARSSRTCPKCRMRGR